MARRTFGSGSSRIVEAQAKVMRFRTVLVIALVGLAGCRSTAAVPTPPEEPPPTPDPVPADFVLTLQRDECYGDCPVYRVTVDALGNVEYEGRKFVSATGTMQWKVSPQVVRHLFQLFEHERFLDLDLTCHRYWSDVPTETIELLCGGRDHVVVNRWGHGSEFLFVEIPDPSELDPDLHLHALLSGLAFWTDVALDTRRAVHGDRARDDLQ